MQILVWLTETVTGDLEELNVSGGGQLFVDRIEAVQRLAHDEQVADYHYKLLKVRTFEFNHYKSFDAPIGYEPRTKDFRSLAGLVVDEAHQFVQAARL